MKINGAMIGDKHGKTIILKMAGGDRVFHFARLDLVRPTYAQVLCLLGRRAHEEAYRYLFEHSVGWRQV